MIIYQSPHIRLIDNAPFISKLQGTGSLIPQCDNQASCNGGSTNLGVICDPSIGGELDVFLFLPNVACNVAPTCSITDVFVNGSSVTFDCALSSDPGPEDCSEGGCTISFDCILASDPPCDSITAEVTCSGVPPVDCGNNSPSAPAA